MITSVSNPQVKHLQQLARKAKVRNEEGVFLAEGIKMFREAPKDKIQNVYISKSLYEEKGQAFLDGTEAQVLDDRVFASVSDTKTPQGILCVIRQFRYCMEDILKKDKPLLLALENLQDPGNVGTILRTAEGAGADAVLLSRGCVDMYNPKTIRSTMGSVYRVPFVYTDDLERMLTFLKERGIHIYAAHLKGRRYYDEEDYRCGCAFLIGNEGNGLSERVSACADTLIRIPMEGRVESLNAAVSASILVYEAFRQRLRQ
ncbi:MAG TPA: 23S rRNA (guanosine(2251)-2'-O)-methyltransferase RlmB [Lachnospiraceae bacterium]|nr:23S rRNA (guanosine(2251)-2'-O)-methyltransferase RlmB [Lachnospiraceae bacterium]